MNVGVIGVTREGCHVVAIIDRSPMQGIGKAVVEELAALGCRVFTCARSGKDLDDCLAEWKAKYVILCFVSVCA